MLRSEARRPAVLRDTDTRERKAGTPYRFVLKNEGSIAHEWMVMPPGATATIQVTFSKSGQYEFACYTPGHYEAGMVLPITIK